MIKIFWLAIPIWIFVNLGCTEIDVPLTDPPIPVTDRAVLIEELTGVSCTNCPKGAAALKAIEERFPGKVYAVGVHGILLSEPVKDRSRYDFRTQAGRDLESSFTFLGKPAAVINRVPFSETFMGNPLTGQWQAAVERELQKPHVLTILAAVNYDEEDRRIQLDITGIPLQDLEGLYTISIYLTESGIIDAQQNGNMIEDNYTHNHVLMDMMTSTNGDVFGTDLKKDEAVRRSYSYTLPTTPEGLWNPDNMQVVIMVAANNGSDRSVQQATGIYVRK